MKLAPPAVVWRVACAGTIAAFTFATTAPCRADGGAGQLASAPVAGAAAAKDKARQRYREGAAAFERGRYKDAIDLFLEADRLVPSAALSFNIARAYEKLGDDAATLRWYRDYLRRAGEPKDAAEVRVVVERLEERLRAKGVQQVTILSEPHGATVTIGEDPVGVTPWTGELVPGAHEVTLTLRGYDDARRTVELSPDDALDVHMRLVQRAEPTPAPAPAARHAASDEPERVFLVKTVASPEPSQSGFNWNTAGWISVGVGVAALGGATVFEILRRRAEDDARKETTQTRYVEAVDTMESRRTTARVLAGVGGGFVVTGAAILAIDAGLFSGKNRTEVSVLCLQDRCGAAAFGAF